MSKIHPSGSKSAFCTLPGANFGPRTLLLRQNFPAAAHKMHLFELEKRNLDML